MIKYSLIILFSFCFLNTFSQKVIKEYWENGNLKFERKCPRIDSIFSFDERKGVNIIQTEISYDSLNFYTKDGYKIDIDSFINLYGSFELNTKSEKKEINKQIKEAKKRKTDEIKALDKLVLGTKKKKIFLDTTKIKLKYFYRVCNRCGFFQKSDTMKAKNSSTVDCNSSINAFYDNQMLDVVKYNFYLINKLNNEFIWCENKGSYITTVIMMLLSKVNAKNENDYEISFKDIYLKDKNNNYFKINEYKNFKLICDK